MEHGLSWIERFWAKVIKSDGCWVWTGSTGPGGYGLFTVNGFTHKAHRLSYFLEYGPIPDKLLVCHRCDNRLCPRPDHLFLGTNQDNMNDMLSKGRHPRIKRATVVTQDEILAIRQKYMTGHYTYKLLAEQHQLTVARICQFIKGQMLPVGMDPLPSLAKADNRGASGRFVLSPYEPTPQR